MNETERKPCLDCASAIPKSARKCSVCGSYQDIRRRFDFSATVLALLVAILSVSGVVVPILKETLATHDSNLQAELIAAEPLHAITTSTAPFEQDRMTFHHLRYELSFSLLLRNSGDRPAVFQGGDILVFGPYEFNDGKVGRVYLSPNLHTKIIAAYASEVLRFREPVEILNSEHFPETVKLATGLNPQDRLFDRLEMQVRVRSFAGQRTIARDQITGDDAMKAVYGVDWGEKGLTEPRVE
jgi:predicted nucleic acid-binding Zn ribbon protein